MLLPVSLPQTKAMPSAGGEVPPPRRRAKEVIMEVTGVPALKSSMTRTPLRPFSAVVRMAMLEPLTPLPTPGRPEPPKA